MTSESIPETKPTSALTRRTLLKNGLAGVIASAMAPSFVPSTVFGRTAPSNRIGVGLIGNGLICKSHVNALAGRDDCQIVALCDCNKSKSAEMKKLVESKGAGRNKGIATYQYSEELIARKDIDAVWVTTPDHWHAPLSNAAMKAGKDVYCEKPLTLSIREGRVLVETARRYGRILQTGSQQRSEIYFRMAVEFIRNKRLGRLQAIRAADH